MIQMKENSSTVNALFLIVILTTETNLVARLVAQGGPVSTSLRRIPTVTGRLGSGGGQNRNSLTMSPYSRGEVVLVVQKMNRTQLLAVLTQTEILREDLTMRVLEEDLVMNLNQKDPTTRGLKVARMTVIRFELQTTFLKC